MPQDTSIGKINYDQGLRVGRHHERRRVQRRRRRWRSTRPRASSGRLAQPGAHRATSSRSPADGTDARVRAWTSRSRPPRCRRSRSPARRHCSGSPPAAHVTLSDQGFDFGCAGKVFGVFDAAVTAKGGSLQSADGFSVHAQMSQNFLSDLTSRAAGVLQQAAAQAAAQIASAQRDVNNAQAEVNRLNTLAAGGAGRPGRQAGRRAAADRRTPRPRSPRRRTRCPPSTPRSPRPGPASRPSGTRPRRRSRTRRPQVNAAQGPVNDLNSQISSLQGQINQLNSDIAWWNNWYNNSSTIQKAYRWAQLAAEVGWRGTKVAGADHRDGHPAGDRWPPPTGCCRSPVQTLQAAQAAAVTYPIDQDPRIVALQASRGAAVLGPAGGAGRAVRRRSRPPPPASPPPGRR